MFLHILTLELVIGGLVGTTAYAADKEGFGLRATTRDVP
jgi:hypothetical protein